MEIKSEKELQDYLQKLKRNVGHTFSLRSKNPNQHLIVSRDKNYPYRILQDGQDVTPLPHYIPELEYLDDEELKQSNQEILDMSWKLFNCSIEDSISEISINSEHLTSMVLNNCRMKRLDVFHTAEQLEDWEEKRKLQNVPSMFRLREEPTKPLQDEVDGYFTRFEETDTIFFLDITARVAPVGSGDARRFEEDNKRKWDTEIKRKFLILSPFRDVFSQTNYILTRDESVQISAPKRDNASVEVYHCDMMRTMIDLGIINPLPRKMTRLSSLCAVKRNKQTTERVEPADEPWKCNIIDQENEKPEEIEWLESLEFLKTASIVERILTANVFSNIQLMYHERLYSKKPVDDFKYTPVLLWTCSCLNTYGKAVTSISWSSLNPEIFAVSYGKYLFEAKIKKGLVCLWNIKNTEFPERMAILPSPVTYVEFSKKYPRIAAVALWEGTVGLLDTVLPEPEFLVKSDQEIGLLEPVWQIKWFDFDGDEILLSCGENGEIHTFETNRKFNSRKILKVQRVGNTVRNGIEMPQINPNYSTGKRGPAITFMAQHPEERKILLVSTDHGYVHVYSLYRPHDPLEVFGAHTGPITAIEFNPVDSRIFLTAGCDFYIRIWGYGIYETYLLQLTYRNLYVDYAAWSPAHPYMIVSLCAFYLDVWNLHRQFHEPVTSVENPYKHRNIVVSFNPTGANFVVGDLKGYVYIYSFTSIPKPPEDPLKKLVEALMFRLSYDEERLKLMAMKLGPPFCPDDKRLKELFSTREIHKL